MRPPATLLRLFRSSSGYLPRARPIPTSPYSSIAYRPSPLFTRLNAAPINIPRRYNSSSSEAESSPRPLTDKVPSASADAANAEQNAARRAEEPAYRIIFTCKPCSHRSEHQMSKHGYHKGTVLITCPSCQSRHVISDHLGIFMDEKSSLEDILAKKGVAVTKGIIEDDMEIWEDGSVYKAGSNKVGVDIGAETNTKETP